MILKDIIEEVNGLLDHNPNVSTHENHVVRLINRHYEDICSAHPWRFLQERTEQQLYADLEGAAGTTLTLTDGSKLVTAAAGTWLHAGMEGAVLEDTANSIEYRIDSVLNTTTAFLTATASPALTATTSFKVKWDKIKLPKDMVDFLGITIRDEIFGQAANSRDRRLVYVDPRTEEDLLLDHTSSGDTIIITDDDSDRTFNNDLSVSSSLQSSGSLVVGNTYEYCVTIEREGIESAPSQVVTATPTSGNRTIRISSLPAVSGTDVYRKRIYRRNQTTKTGWYQITEVVPAASPSAQFDDSGTGSLDYTRPLYYEGPRDMMRLYKRPDVDIKCEIRYMRRPPRLVGNNDEPQIPPQYHVILVYKTVAELYTQYGQGNIANIYESKAEQRLQQMKKRYLDRSDRLYRRGQFQEMPSGYAYLYGDPVKT